MFAMSFKTKGLMSVSVQNLPRIRTRPNLFRSMAEPRTADGRCSSDFGRRKPNTENKRCKTFTKPNAIIRLHENFEKGKVIMKFPGGMDMQSMLRQAQQMQEQMGREMKEMVVEASAGGGAVSVKMRGDFFVVEVKISPDTIKEGDTEMIQDLTVAAL